MNCNQVVSENLIERYLDGQLDDAARDALELHYFECESCLVMLQTLQTVRPALAQLPAPARLRKRTAHWRWLPIAAAIVLAALFWWKGRPAPSVAQAPMQAPILAVLQLSDVQPAPYSPTLFRDGSVEPGAAWDHAMRLYQQRQWAAAAAELAQAASQPATLHFAGISYLLAGQIDPALSALDRVIALGPKSPFEEEARFYRAQALLLAGRTIEARAELDRVVNTRGDYEARARTLASKL